MLAVVLFQLLVENKELTAETFGVKLGIKMDTIGQRIFAARKKQGITQGDIASALGISVNMVSKWENEIGTPRQPKHIDALAKILGVSKVFLIFGEDYFDDDALSVEDKMARLTTQNKELAHKFVDLLLEHQGNGKTNQNGE